jgi:hypothetical protein
MSNLDELSAQFTRMTNLNPPNKQGWDSKASVDSQGNITHILSNGSWGKPNKYSGGKHRKSNQNKSRYRKKYKGTRINKTRRYKR